MVSSAPSAMAAATSYWPGRPRAFSRKERGTCPSCCTRRMAKTATHPVDQVMPGPSSANARSASSDHCASSSPHDPKRSCAARRSSFAASRHSFCSTRACVARAGRAHMSCPACSDMAAPPCSTSTCTCWCSMAHTNPSPSACGSAPDPRPARRSCRHCSTALARPTTPKPLGAGLPALELPVLTTAADARTAVQHHKLERLERLPQPSTMHVRQSPFTPAALPASAMSIASPRIHTDESLLSAGGGNAGSSACPPCLPAAC